MDHEYLPQLYSAELTRHKSALCADAAVVEQEVLQRRTVIAIMVRADLVHYKGQLEARWSIIVDKVHDLVSRMRDEAIAIEKSIFAETLGELTKAHSESIIGKHQRAYNRVCEELERYADTLINQILRTLYTFIQASDADHLKQHPMNIRVEPGQDKSPGMNHSQKNWAIIGITAAMLLLSTVHGVSVTRVSPELSDGHVAVFLAIGVGVMLLRFAALFLTERNGSFEKGLHWIEMLLSAALMGLLILHCIEHYNHEPTTDALLYCARELLLGTVVVLAFHRFVHLAITRLRDWKGHGKRHW